MESHEPQPDHFLGSERLRSLATNKIAGYESFFGVLDPKTNQLRFWEGISLQGGVINTFASIPNDTRTFTGQIIGGTGKFRGAVGTVLYKPIGNTDQMMMIMRFRL